MKRIAWTAMALAAVLMTACSKTNPEKALTPVTVRAAEQYSGEEPLRYSANVEPYATVNLAFKVSGYVAEILQVRGADGRVRNIQDGDFVQRGTLLARLRQTEFLDRVAESKARLAESDAELEKARLDFERAQTLYGTHSLTKPDYDSAKARHDAAVAKQQGATAAVQQAEVELHDSSLRAPANGVLLKRAVEIGSLVNPAALAFVLADTRSMKVVFGVPDITVAQAPLGATLKITTDALGTEELAGRVTRVAPAADPQTRLFDVEVTLPNPGQHLKSGMIASLRMPRLRAPEPATLVPLTAVVALKSEPSAYAVYVVEESAGAVTARRRRVKLGTAYGNAIAITDGVRPGERVVATGTMLLTDGDRVRVVPQVVPQ